MLSLFCTIYIEDDIIETLERFESVDWSEAFFAGYLAMLCIFFSLGFYYFDQSSIFNDTLRQGISDYAVPLAVVICIRISYKVSGNVDVFRIKMPRNFQPIHADGYYGEKRSWYQGFGGSRLVVDVSLIASVPIVALFYIDHLFSCILSQKPELVIKKGEYYHSSMLVAGICNMILPSFGIPFVTALLAHSPQFTKALSEYDKNKTPWKINKVHESRVAPTLVYVLCCCGLVVPSVLELCPEGVVNGIMAFVGLQAQLSWYRIHIYTMVQLVCLAA